jgi:glucose/arabinose dehydrogenase
MTKNARLNVAFPFYLLVLAFPSVCSAGLSLVVERVASGLDQPDFVTHAPGEPGRVYIIEQGASGDFTNPGTGKIKTLDLSTGAISTFLEIPNMGAQGEQGLLGLAFHPDYANNGKFYVNYVENNPNPQNGVNVGTTKIVEYQRGAGPNPPPPTVSKTVLKLTQPYNNHNAGWMAFSPQANDPYLYVTVGDGGSGGDPHRNGQNPSNLFSTMLRLDIDADDFPADPDKNYAIPNRPGTIPNPFVSSAGTERKEIWAYGLRNTWRASFDQNGDLYMGDVGQRDWEEINFQPANSTGGENYGWCLREGADWSNPSQISCNDPAKGAPLPGDYPTEMVDPIYAFPRGSGAAITGGYVYRGPISELNGKYIFAEYISGQIMALEYDGTAPTTTIQDPFAQDPAYIDITYDGTNFNNLETLMLEYLALPNGQMPPEIGMFSTVSFGLDATGNLYIVDYGSRTPSFQYVPGSGQIFRVVAVPEPSAVLFCLLAAGLIGVRQSKNCLNLIQSFGKA